MQAIGMALVTCLALGFVAVRGYAVWVSDHQACVCKHRRNQHVSSWDWDSDYGDPMHVGGKYRKPGTCRQCRCRSFYAAA